MPLTLTTDWIHAAMRQALVSDVSKCCLCSFPFDSGHLLSQVPCSLVGRVAVLGDRTAWCNGGHNKFNENEELNGNKKDRNKTTVNHITSSQWRNSLGSALNRRNRGIVTTLFLPLVSSPGCPVLSIWKAVSCALKASILSSRSLGYSGNCLSLRLIRWYNLPVLGCSLEEWEIDFCKPQCGVSLSV